MTPEQLKAARFRLSITQRELAERMGVSTKSISNYEQGCKRIPGWLPKFIELLEKEDGR